MIPLDTIKLQTFITIVREGSFTKAAEYLSLTQPTVSQQIAMLEQHIGAALFIRQPRRLRLTEAGNALLGYAERILALSEEAFKSTREAANLAQRTVRLGVGHTLAIYLLPNLLHRLREQEPDVETRIQVGNTRDLLTATADGQVELAIVGSPAVHDQLKITPIMDDELVVILNPDDPWSERTEVTPDDLRTRKLITRERGSALHASVAAIFGTDHLNGPQTMILGETEAIKRSVEAGLGIALVQGIAIQREVAQRNLQTIPLKDAPIQRRYNVAQPKNAEPSGVAQLLIRLLLDEETSQNMVYKG